MTPQATLTSFNVSSLRDLFDLGKRLEDLGYVDGKNIILIARDAGTEPKAIEDTIGAVLRSFGGAPASTSSCFAAHFSIESRSLRRLGVFAPCLRISMPNRQPGGSRT